MFGITFTSPLAFKLANLSALGFLGFLGFVGLSEIDGLRWCLGFLGFSGFFGLIGVASIVETAHRRKANARMATDGHGADGRSALPNSPDEPTGVASPQPATSVRPVSRLLGLGLLLAGVGLAGLLFFEESRTHNARFFMLTGEIPKLQQQWSAAQAEAFQARTALSRFEVNAINAGTDAEQRSNEIKRRRLTNAVTQAGMRGTAAQQQIPAVTDAINQLRFPSLATLLALWPAGLLVLAGLFLLAWQPGGAEVGRSSSFRYAAVLLVAPVMLLGFLFLLFPSQSPFGATHFDLAPIGLSSNVVIVDVTAEVGRGHAELRAALDGPQLPAATEAALVETFSPPFAGTFIKPTPYAGNQPFRILSPGRQTWRLGFVLPDAALAKDAFENLRPIGPLPVVTGRTVAGTLFEVRQTNGKEFHATLQVAPPITAADPNWVSVSGQSQHNETAVSLQLDVLASWPGMARLIHANNPTTALLQQHSRQTNLHAVSVRLELTKVGANRVRFVRRIGNATATEEFPGSFRDLAVELLRTRTLSAKTERGVEVQLCKFQGKPVTVQVNAT